MRYEEYTPPAELSPWVRLFWVYECKTEVPQPETIVADGCPELIIHFRTPFAEADGFGHLQQQPVAIACGQLTHPLTLHSSPDAGMIGIRFEPSGMAPFVSLSMNTLTDTRVAACNRYLLRTMTIGRDSSVLRRALEKISETGGNIGVDELATHMGRSRRSVELAFQKQSEPLPGCIAESPGSGTFTMLCPKTERTLTGSAWLLTPASLTSPT